MEKQTEQTPWLMTAEALWDFVARDADSTRSTSEISHNTLQEDEEPLFI